MATLENIRLNFPIFDPPPPMFVCLFNMYSPAPQRTFALVSYPSPPPPQYTPVSKKVPKNWGVKDIHNDDNNIYKFIKKR